MSNVHFYIMNLILIRPKTVCLFSVHPQKAFDFVHMLEHRKLGWKVIILKHYLCKSLSKELWCKMADTKTFVDYIFKKMNNACSLR